MNGIDTPGSLSRAYFRPSAVVAAMVAMALGVSLQAARGQDSRPAASQPTTQDADPADAVMDRLLDTQRPATEPSGAASEDQLDAGDLSGRFDRSTGSGDQVVAPDTPPKRLIREGNYIIDRVGRVARTPDGELEFLFDADGVSAGANDAPMLLLPNLNLMAVERTLERDRDARLRVTGRVTEYRGRNHLMLEKVVVLR